MIRPGINDAISLDGRYYWIININGGSYLLRNIVNGDTVKEDLDYILKYGKMADQETIKLYRVLFG